MKDIGALVDLALERTVLGQILAFGLCAVFDEAGLAQDDFYREEHRLVYAAALKVQDAGGTADLVTTGQQLRLDGHLERVSVPYLSTLTDGVPKPARANVLLEIARLQELSAGRAGFYAAQDIQRELQKPGGMADGALLRHLDAVQAIVERQQTDKAAPFLDVDGQLRAHEQDAALSLGQRVYFGLPALDEGLGGVRRGEVCGLFARPGVGKTVVLCHIARTVAESVGHVVFSLEMPASQIVGRLKQLVYGIGRHELEERSRVNPLPEEPYRQAFRNLVIVDTPSLSVAEMGRRTRQIANGPLKGIPIGLVTIDHMGLVGGDRSLSTYDRVSAQARDIKEFAKRMGCAVTVAVQVSREAGGSSGERELTLGAARDSGVVEEAMDYMVGFRRLDRSPTLEPFKRQQYHNVLFAKVIKNRHGDPDHRETAYRFFPVGLRLQEDAHLRADENDVAAIAERRTGGRR